MVARRIPDPKVAGSIPVCFNFGSGTFAYNILSHIILFLRVRRVYYAYFLPFSEARVLSSVVEQSIAVR